jgi:hypothetical protein
MVPKKRSTTCPILQRSGSELFSRRNNTYRFVHIYNSFINLRKGHYEGPKCKTVSPQGASRVPGIDISVAMRAVRAPLTIPSSLARGKAVKQNQQTNILQAPSYGDKQALRGLPQRPSQLQ